MKDYILSTIIAAVVAGGPLLFGGALSYWGLLFACVLYVGFGIFNYYHAYDLLKRLNKLSQSGHKEAAVIVNNIINSESVIGKLLEAVISAIIFVILGLAGYFYLPFTIVAVAAACFFMFKSTDMIDLVGAEIRRE